MSHDSRALSRDGHLDDHVVLGVCEKWTPEKEYLLLDRNRAQIVEHCLDIRLLNRSHDMTQEGSFVLDNKRNRNCDLERPATQLPQKFK